jgi:DNA glycosylase AlkZ-like
VPPAKRPTGASKLARGEPEEVLGPRALNRALLARQLLLQRVRMPAEGAIAHLVGMQAQAPNAPYVGLWTRLEDFRKEELAGMVSERTVVRSPLMRTTLHLVTARDCLALRPLMQPVLERGFHKGSPFGRRLGEIDVEGVLAEGRALLDERPRTTTELAKLLGAKWPEKDPVALAHAVRYLVPLAQIPPRGIWGAIGLPTWATVESWLGKPLRTDMALDVLILRYLAAFGPATIGDIQAWCWLTRLGSVIETLRPHLRTFRDMRGRELFDLPGAPRPDPESPTPVRFLPEYDNVLLSHADRARIMAPGQRLQLPPGGGGVRGSILVDGFYQGLWTITIQKGTATLLVEPFAPLSATDRETLAEEGRRLLAFAASEAGGYNVQFMKPPSAQ